MAERLDKQGWETFLDTVEERLETLETALEEALLLLERIAVAVEKKPPKKGK